MEDGDTLSFQKDVKSLAVIRTDVENRLIDVIKAAPSIRAWLQTCCRISAFVGLCGAFHAQDTQAAC